jgi:hypothetical protein
VATATKIAHLSRHSSPRQWNKFPSQRSAPQNLRAGTMYWFEGFGLEWGGNDHLAVGVVKPDGTDLLPVPVEKDGVAYLFTEKVEQIQPRAMAFQDCAGEGEQCAFANTAVVRYSLGFGAVVPDLYTVASAAQASGGLACRAFGSGVGGD